jgi:hypothetical protein
MTRDNENKDRISASPGTDLLYHVRGSYMGTPNNPG